MQGSLFAAFPGRGVSGCRQPGSGRRFGPVGPLSLLALITLSAVLGAAPLRVACVGDSITFGAGIPDRGRASYPAQLGRMAGEEWDVRNFGVSGRTLLRRGDYPYVETDQYRAALAFRPDVVVIKLGTNDTKPQNRAHMADFAADLRALTDAFAAQDNTPRIYLCLPVPAYPGRWGISDDVLKADVIPAVRGVASERGLPLIDLYTALSGNPELFPDTVHPNAEGARMIAETVYREVSGKEPGPFPGARSDWHGFARYDFTVGGVPSIAVVPRKTAPGTPWIWRARFFGHEPQTDVALLNRGFHLVYTDVADLYGAPAAVARWNRFYEYLTREHGFARKAALEGMSRGGLIVYNWAAENPEKVACIYADAPVCDIRTWPRQKSPADWERCLRVYGLTEDDVAGFRGSPIDRLVPLAEYGVPLFHVCGGADDVVPVATNTAVIEQRYRALGGSIEVIIKPDCGHHPHSLQDPTPIVDFILRHTVGDGAKREVRLPAGALANSIARFRGERRGRVAFLGGSITFMDGYRPRVAEALQRVFPDTEFEFINAGISSTCSTTGAFRLHRDVFGGGPVDLLFVEFAVNDNQDAGHDPAACVRGMEGIVRGARLLNPAVDIVQLYCINDAHRDSYLRGEEPREIVAHRRVAAAYGVAEANVAAEVAERMRAGEFDWKQFGGTHPAPFGNDLYGATLAALLERALKAPGADAARIAPHPLPEPLDPLSYARGTFLPPESVPVGPGWTRGVPDWDSLPGSKRGEFLGRPLVWSETPGASLTVPFSGDVLGLYVLAGPDAGVVTVSVDGGTPVSLNLYHGFSGGLHYPRTVVASGAGPGKHTAVLTVAEQSDSRSRGTAVRVLEFCVNTNGDERAE